MFGGFILLSSKYFPSEGWRHSLGQGIEKHVSERRACSLRTTAVAALCSLAMTVEDGALSDCRETVAALTVGEKMPELPVISRSLEK